MTLLPPQSFVRLVRLSSFLLAFSATGIALAQSQPQLLRTDRVRLAEAFRLADQLEAQVWKGWRAAPFAVLLVTPEYEFLVRHPNPPTDFTPRGYDALLNSKVYCRKRQFQTNFLATFPFAGVPTIVVGRAEDTATKTSTPWVVTLLHEHFHQWQDSQPDYFGAVDALQLARGDTSGMWMLNYPFPYDSAAVERQFSQLAQRLAGAIASIGKADFEDRLADYLKTRKGFQELLAADDYRYFSFQLWQEGIARYTELRIAALAASKYKPTKTFRALPDFTGFDQVADAIRGNIIGELPNIRLSEWKRVAFYDIGAGEALLLDRASPGWQQLYLGKKFFLEEYFPK